MRGCAARRSSNAGSCAARVRNSCQPAWLAAYKADVCSGRRHLLVSGLAVVVCTLSHDDRYAVVRVGRRAARRLLLIATRTGSCVELLGKDATVADARFGGRVTKRYMNELRVARRTAVPATGY